MEVAVKRFTVDDPAPGLLGIEATCIRSDRDFAVSAGLTRSEADGVESATCPYCNAAHALLWQSDAINAGVIRPVSA